MKYDPIKVFFERLEEEYKRQVSAIRVETGHSAAPKKNEHMSAQELLAFYAQKKED